MEQERLDITVRKPAEATAYATVQGANAERDAANATTEADAYKRTKIAEANKVAAVQDAEAAAEAVRLAGVAERDRQVALAAGIQAEGEARGAAIAAEGLAEARAIDAKAEALKKYGEAALASEIIARLPEITRAVAEPLASISEPHGHLDRGRVGGHQDRHRRRAARFRRSSRASPASTCRRCWAAPRCRAQRRGRQGLGPGEARGREGGSGRHGAAGRLATSMVSGVGPSGPAPLSSLVPLVEERRSVVVGEGRDVVVVGGSGHRCGHARRSGPRGRHGRGGDDGRRRLLAAHDGQHGVAVGLELLLADTR